ncbi:MAG: TIGR04190 family B12-binding domain/radical SAM domain protein [Candidatus Thermoplasmatota archaeon]|nr:TIGR04190 family B12-binding domain/radical SAM domain protein [Candidatus Thermoplasmatota archaeon]
MASLDLLLMHPPNVMDFRKRTMLLGPISDLIPSTPVFEMYPIGFTTIASHLDSKGYRVRIANIATRMLASKRFDPSRFVKSVDAKLVGIDLHWMPHVQGALELARIVKVHHPETPVVLGGFSASYYHEEILSKHPYVDFVMRGDSTEKPLEMLIQALQSGRPLDSVPNLTWRKDKGVKVNPLTHIPETLDEVVIDYGLMIRKVLRYGDLEGHLPYRNWKSNPMSIAVSVRGCTHNCVNCAGSCDSFAVNFGRSKPAFRSPKLLAEDVATAEQYVKGATFVVGDIRQAGKQYASKFLSELGNHKVRNEIVIELFTPADREFADQVAKSVDRFSVQMSPETHDEVVRRAQGKSYTNESLERTAEAMLDAGCGRFDMFYMIGLPLQTPESVKGTVEYARKLYTKFKGKRLFPFISPLAPFLDPGGNAFESPEMHGFRLFASTLEDHLKLATMPSWKYVLNYETVWLTRSAIVEATYSSGLGMNRIKREVGLITEEVADRTANRIVAAHELSNRIDAIVGKGTASGGEIEALREAAMDLSESTVCEKTELDWTEDTFWASVPRIMGALVRRR